MTGLLRRIADGALTAAASLGVVALLAGLGAVALDVRPVFFRSGSMAPSIGTGSMALTRAVAARDLRPGDVVSVRTASGARVTHRVVTVTPSGDGALLTLRGDANHGVDPESYRLEAAYRVFWHVDDVGYVVGAMRSPFGLFGAGAVATALVALALGRGGRDRRRRGPPGHRAGARDGRARAVVATAAVATVTAAGPAGPASAAAWTDAVPISGTTFTTGTVPAPVLSCGALSLLSVTFSWTPVTGATGYTLHYGIGGGSTVAVAGTSYTFLSAISGGTAWVVANHDYGSTTWSSVASGSRTYSVAVVSLCS